MDSARRIRLIRIASVIAVALGAGHVAQSGSTPKIQYSQRLPDPVFGPAAAGLHLEPPEAGGSDPVVALPEQVRRPPEALPARLELPVAATPASATDCTPHLTLAALADAVIDARLSAPCQTGARVVVGQDGLAVAYRTKADGTLDVRLPALTANAHVSVLFRGGATVEATIAVPDALEYSHFGVQWLGSEGFGVESLHAVPASRQRLLSLGDPRVERPMRAEILTYPASVAMDGAALRASITPETCGHDLLGETLTVTGGRVRAADLSVTMPACNIVGDYLVLKDVAATEDFAAAE